MNIINNRPIIIGIDHGYGNIKTANCCFKTGVASFDKEPTFKSNLLVYEGRYYLIGEEHKEFTADKMADSDYFILTLAAIGRELNIRKQTSAVSIWRRACHLPGSANKRMISRSICCKRIARTLHSGAWSIILILSERTFFPRVLPLLQTI